MGDDPYCVVSGSYIDDTTITLCEEVTYTTVDVRAHTALPAHINGVLVGSGSDMFGNPSPVYRFQERFFQTTSVEYRTLADSCSISDTQHCVTQEVTVCQESGMTSELWRNVADGVQSCIYVCEQTGLSGTQSNCRIMCEGFVCETHMAYFGDACHIDPVCEESVTQELYTPNPIAWNPLTLPGSIMTMSEYCDESFVVGGTRYCSLSDFVNSNPSLLAYNEDPDRVESDFYDAGYLLSVVGTDTVLYTQDVQYVTEIVCQDITVEATQTYCIPNDQTLNISGNLLTCTDPSLTSVAPPQNFGDYWCPVGFVYDNDLGVCVSTLEQDICDFVLQGETPQCENIFADDDLGYNDGCVDTSTFVPVGTTAYDETCCYAATFNDNDIYQQTGVTVY